MAPALAAAAAIAMGIELASASRQTVRLDLGWRFSLGANPSGTCETPFPINLNGIQCQGLSYSPAMSPNDCAANACNSNAQVWQYCPGGATCGAASCWIGAASNCTVPQAGWVSQAQNTSAPWLPSPSQPGFDDSSWTVLDLPHDFEIGGNFSQSAPSGGEGFLPYNVSFYRKHLVLLPEWQGSHIEVYIEGALSAATFWFQGKQLASRTSGYTSAIVRLDNVPGIIYSNTSYNELVIFVDGTAKTGW